MERRKFIIGTGALAAGASAAVGSGAFSAAQINDRDADIEVGADDEALVQLIPGHDYGEDGTVPENRVGYESGQLYINFDDDGGPNSGGDGSGTGVGRNSVYQVGSLGEDAQDLLQQGIDDGDFDGPDPRDSVLYGDTEINEDPAFVIRNESDQEYVFELSYDAESTPNSDEATAMLAMFSGEPDQGFSSGGAAVLAIELGDGSVVSDQTTASLAPGEKAWVGLILETEDVDVNDDGWEGSLRINVGEEARFEE